MNEQALSRWAIALLALHVILGLGYSIATPVWEANDEPSHFEYVKYIANHGQLLPAQNNNYEGKQPPLYYALMALSTFWLQPAAPIDFHQNPNAITGVDKQQRFADRGYNVFVHGPDEAFPYQGIPLAVHIARWLTVLLGSIAVGFTFLTARLLFPGRPVLALTATAIHGFAPMALFVSASVNNDTLAIVFASAALYASVRLLNRARPRDLLWPAAALALGALSKFNALTVAPAAGVATLVALIHAARTLPRARLRRLILGLLAFGVLGTLAGWLYLNDLTSREQLDVPISQIFSSFGNFVTNPLSSRFSWQLLPGAFDYGFVSFWALFGWSNLGVSAIAYELVSILCWLSLSGLLLGLVRGTSRSEAAGLLLLALGLLSTIIFMAYFVIYSRSAPAFQGRYLMVAVTAISILLATGFGNLFPRRWQSPALLTLALAFILWGAFIPFQIIAPAYAQPAPLPESALAQLPNHMQLVFGDGLFELAGYQTELDSAQVGTAFPVTLFWHVLKPTPDDFTVAVHLRSLDGTPIEVASFDSLPARGNYSTSLWVPGTIVADRHLVRLAPGVSRLSGAQFVVSMYTQPTSPTLEVHAAGQPAQRAATFGRFRVLPDGVPPPAAPHPLHYQVADELSLSGYDIAQAPGALTLKLYWQPLRTPRASYATFVHVTVDNQLIAQFDGVPLGGALPTDLWRPNDMLVDQLVIPLPPSFDVRRAQLWAGMYSQDTQQRLAVTDQKGQAVPDDRIPIPIQ